METCDICICVCIICMWHMYVFSLFGTIVVFLCIYLESQYETKSNRNVTEN